VKVQNAHAKVVGYGFGGNGANVRLAVTLSFQLALADSGDGGFADYCFSKIPELWAALTAKEPLPKAELVVDAAQAFDGLSAHEIKIWGLSRLDRQPGAEPIVATAAGNISGKVDCKIVRGDGGVIADVRVKFSAPTSMFGGLTVRELGSQYKGECWVDVEQLQSELAEAVKPAKRPSVEDRQLPLVGEGDGEVGEAEGDDSEDGGEGIWDGIDFGAPGDYDVMLIAVPVQAHDLALALATLPNGGAMSARRTVIDVREGKILRIARAQQADAHAIVEILEGLGASAHAIPHGDDCPFSDATSPEPEAVTEPDLPDEDWKPVDLAGRSDEEISAAIMAMTVEQARAQFLHSTGRATRISDLDRLTARLVHDLKIPQHPSGPRLS